MIEKMQVRRKRDTTFELAILRRREDSRSDETEGEEEGTESSLDSRDDEEKMKKSSHNEHPLQLCKNAHERRLRRYSDSPSPVLFFSPSQERFPLIFLLISLEERQ